MFITLINYNFLDIFQFKKNKLYHFLNSTLDGRIILGVYEKTKCVEYGALNHLIIVKLLNKDPLNYK